MSWRNLSVIALLLSAFSVPLFFSGCQSGEVPQPTTRRIIILTNGNSPFWDAAATGADDAAKELDVESAGLTVVVDRNDFKVEGQIDKLKQYANATDVVAVGISVTDANNAAIADEMRKLIAAGIKVVTIDSDVDRAVAGDARTAYLGTDNIMAGRALGKAAHGIMPEGGEYATFVGLKSAANAKERIGGFAEGADAVFEQVENMGDDGDAGTARKNVRDALDRHPDLKMLVGIWSYNTPAIVDIVKEMDIRDKMKIVGFDAEPPAIESMAEGMVDVMVVQNPYEMGKQGVRLMKALVENDEKTVKEMLPKLGEEGGDLYDTGLRVVVPDGETLLLSPESFGTGTEFLTLSEFRKWLQDNGLTGS